MIDRKKAVTLLQDLIRINTTNPPGNEEEAVLFLESLLKAKGIRAEIHSPAPKRANLMARIRGKRPGKPVVLLSHLDVVPATEKGWEVDPFGGVLKDGFVYGRGAVDMKSHTVCHFLAFTALHEEGVVPETDVVFLATCDEEVGGTNGVDFMLKRSEYLRDASFVLSEGGFITEEEGVLHGQVTVAEKELSQFTIRARGTGGHGSMPHNDNANEKIVTAATSILSHPWPLKATPIVSAYMNGIMKGRKWKGFTYATLREALREKPFRDFVESNRVYNSLLRNTVTLTILQGGSKTNVIPTESTATFDARLLPDENRERFLARIKRLVGPSIEVVPINPDMGDAKPSRHGSRYFRAVGRAVRAAKGPIPVLPSITTGATDLRYFRNLGIPAYGFFPATLSREEHMGMHSVNERIAVEHLEEGAEGTYTLLRSLAALTEE